MSGKPAARQGDMTQVGGPIVQGSAGVLIGAPTGVACSVCPTGEASPKYGNPVNPLLGAKVLPGETDIALPGPLPFVLSRAYSSYRTKTPAPVGLCGPGWKLPSDLWLQLRGDGLILNDNGGRSVHFEPLAPGEIQYSRSESFWLARGGAASQHNSHPLSVMWGMLPEAVRLCPHIYLATNSPQGPWWVLGWAERVPGADEALPAPLPPYRVLTGVVDGYGRRLTYHRDGAYGGAVTAVTDSTGRRYRLVLTTQAQRAAQAASASSSSLSPAPSSFPSFSSPPSPRSPSSWSETLPVTACGEDSGIRLSAVWLVEDPACPDALPSQPLVRYGYTARGELEAVYDRSGAEVRRFEYDAGQPGRMTAHRYAGRPASRYRYDDAGRVTEQVNPEGLGYAFAYEKNKITVTDSLGRREVLHTEGEGGLKRVVMKASADGSVTRSRYDASGRPEWQTDATGRKTTYSPDVATGKLTAVTGPDGRKTKYSYNDRQQLTTTVYPDGLRSTREYDERGRLTEKTDRIPEGVVIRMNDERTHRYEYDNQHRLVHYVRTQHGETQAEGRYLYDPLGRRVGKRVWKRERVHWSDTRMELSRRPYVTWYGWEGDRLTTIQTGQSRVQTLYAPGSFTPLVRIETDAAEQAKAQHRSLAEKLSQEGSEDGQAVQLPAALTAMLDRLEGELRRNAVSEESRAWLAGCGLTPEQMAEQLEPEYTPQRKIHLYHCDQRGLPLALVTPDNTVAWRGEYDEWGNLSGEENPEHLELVIRLPGQQYDEESGLYYNRHRYYNPGQGRYITQDPIGLKGGWNLYQYPLNPVTGTDPLGLKVTFKGDEEQQKAMKEAYESVRKTKHGQEMIEKMELSDHDYIFRGPRKGMEHTCYDPSEYTFYIEIDSDHAACQYQGKGKACKLTPTPLSVVIAHEMGHAMGENDDGPGHMNNVKKHENPVRKEMGIPPRMKY
ncbi:RHS repeat protein [Salmonella enterica subsp. enterica serovar Dublin]|nr:hypothetical protein [Salmonella enterica]EEW9959054.1 RHS repeat protein [Salmonella enterica subsp. enterica serovar Dublin]EKN9119409.1 RHS repeat protein [Salmonella enterica]EMB9372953.1 RHS repeat protein [Salmonella enterica subsp. enterica serovar Dublin]